MKTVFVIDDDTHSDAISKHNTFEEAFSEIKRLASIPWDQEPNAAPCANWRSCGRHYEIVEYDTSSERWSELSRIPILEISAKGVCWLVPPDHTGHADVTGRGGS